MIPPQDYDFLHDAGVAADLRSRHQHPDAAAPRSLDARSATSPPRLTPRAEPSSSRAAGRSTATGARSRGRSRSSSRPAPTTAPRPTRCSTSCCPRPGGAVRVGITGAPGAGKSTFIEALGLHLVDARPPGRGARGRPVEHAQRRLDPRRQDAHGAARRVDPDAFIRPSPTGGTLGGVARRTREAMLLCEAAGFDVVLVETVGVGQSEVAVAGMVDLFLLLVAPGGGDELQG